MVTGVCAYVCVCVCVYVCVCVCVLPFSSFTLFLAIVSFVSLPLASASVDGSPTLHHALALLGCSNGCTYIMLSDISKICDKETLSVNELMPDNVRM